MGLLEIKIYDDPVLREKALPIGEITPRHRQLAADMIETMKDARGIGIAANQVGVTERIIVVDVDWPDYEEKNKDAPPSKVMINPEVTAESAEDELDGEGCLSLPGIRGDVWRAVKIKYRYQDLDGKWHEKKAKDLEARCILHEIDHLDGVLFLDRMATGERRALAGALAELRRGGGEAQEA